MVSQEVQDTNKVIGVFFILLFIGNAVFGSYWFRRCVRVSFYVWCVAVRVAVSLLFCGRLCYEYEDLSFISLSPTRNLSSSHKANALAFFSP